MSNLYSNANGMAMPVPGTVYGNAGLPSALGPYANPNVSWIPVPASGSLLSNIYSPVPPSTGLGEPQLSYINNGTIASGPYTSNNVRTFNVVTQNQMGYIPPPGELIPQYRPTVMGTLSRMSEVIPTIPLQNRWYPPFAGPVVMESLSRGTLPPPPAAAMNGSSLAQTTGSGISSPASYGPGCRTCRGGMPWVRPQQTQDVPSSIRYGFR